MKIKRGLMRLSRTTRDPSSHVKPGHMNGGFWHSCDPSERGRNSQAQEPSNILYLSLSSPTPETSNAQTTLEETNPSACFILLPYTRAVVILKASANFWGVITHCCLLRMNGSHSWCDILVLMGSQGLVFTCSGGKKNT